MVPSTDRSNYHSKSEAFIQSCFLMEDAFGSLGMMELGETTACSSRSEAAVNKGLKQRLMRRKRNGNNHIGQRCIHLKCAYITGVLQWTSYLGMIGRDDRE